MRYVHFYTFMSGNVHLILPLTINWSKFTYKSIEFTHIWLQFIEAVGAVGSLGLLNVPLDRVI